MSLEQALKDHTEALTANTDIHTKMYSLLSKQAGGGEEEAPRSRRRAAEAEEPEERPSRRRREDAEEQEEQPSRRTKAVKDDEGEEEAPRKSRSNKDEEKPPARKGKAGKLKVADVRAAFANFLEDQTKKEETQRRGFLEDILTYLKVDKMTDIEERDFAGAIKAVKEYADGNDVKFEKVFGDDE